ncbi:hypothetical protein JTB14_018909 [Gonioctena quinquepunctata]|nr:hypothetical protein JTB14_018909 [Gonioctena quinquepunctata]
MCDKRRLKCRVVYSFKPAWEPELNSIPELSSDHNPVLITLGERQNAQVNSFHHITNWDGFQNSLEKAYCASENPNTIDEIDTAIVQFETTILEAINNNTIRMQKPAATFNKLPKYIEDKTKEKNRARANFQRTLAREHKT